MKFELYNYPGAPSGATQRKHFNNAMNMSEAVYKAIRDALVDKDGHVSLFFNRWPKDSIQAVRFVEAMGAAAKAMNYIPIDKDHLVEAMMAFEDGGLSDHSTILLFQLLLDHDMLGKLQGHYGRVGAAMLARGEIRPKKRMESSDGPRATPAEEQADLCRRNEEAAKARGF